MLIINLRDIFMETEKGRKNFNIGGEKWRVLRVSIVFSDANKILNVRSVNLSNCSLIEVDAYLNLL